MRVWLIGILLTLAIGVAGCGTGHVLLGTEQSQLLVGLDDVALPGQTVELKVRFQAGDLLSAQVGYAVRFYTNGRLYKVAETDDGGVARVSFTPEQPGDYVFVAKVAPVGITEIPPPAAIRITCRHKDAPIVVVDMDKTIVASGFHLVLIGNPAAAENSAVVLKRIAQDNTIIYLTHRPDYFGIKSKRWLEENDYPPGPVLLASVGQFLKGSRSYKSGTLERLQERFCNIRLGIGDKITDVIAYDENGIGAFLILLNIESADSETLESLAESLTQLPQSIQVVSNWAQIEKSLFEGETYRPGAMILQLQNIGKQHQE